MQKEMLVLLTLLLCTCFSLPAFADERPAPGECVFIHLRSSDGWWLSVNHDGSGAYGFGTGLARVAVNQKTFKFEEVYTGIDKIFGNKPESSENAYMAVSYWVANTSSAIEYPIALDRQFLASLFRTSRGNIRPPNSEQEKKWHDHVESNWAKSQWKAILPEEQPTADSQF